MIKILSVDDELDLELLLTQYFRRKIRKGEYEFFFAHNGLEAMQMLLQHPDIDIVLSDINMPEMDGLTLLKKIKDRNNPALKVVMVSAYGEMSNIREAMNNGAFDFATKPIDLDDLQRTIDKAQAEIEFVKQTQKEHGQLVDIKADLSLASEVQLAILPREFPPFADLASVIDIHATMKPAKDVGGDFYDFYFVGEDKVAICIADVSGKGIPAAMFMMRSKSMLKNSASTGLSIAEVFNRVNSNLAVNNETNTFITCWMAVINIKTGEVQYINGGHNAPLLRHSDGLYEYIEDPMPGLPLAVIEDFPYQVHTATLRPGDALFLYTDGVTEAENVSKAQYGEDRLLDTLNQLPMQDIIDPALTCKAIMKSVHEFAKEAEQSDDITMLSFKYLG